MELTKYQKIHLKKAGLEEKKAIKLMTTLKILSDIEVYEIIIGDNPEYLKNLANFVYRMRTIEHLLGDDE